MICCSNCNRPFPEAGVPYCCPVCGGIYDSDTLPLYDPGKVDSSQPGIWRYQDTFSLPPGSPVVSLGEGNTPLVWLDEPGLSLAVKCEFQNPTGSFKDRGSAVLASFLLSRGVEFAVEDSSGNAGASCAAYLARASIRTRIYVPNAASGPKIKQIRAYGAEVIVVPGTRAETMQVVQKTAKEEGFVYASHAYLPFNLYGYATLAYELWNQLGQAPGTVMLPVGQGGLLLGIGRGFLALRQTGLIDSLPLLVGVQARACAPLWAFYSYGQAGLSWVSEGETVAEGIRVSFPLRGDVILKLMENQGGIFRAVDEEEIPAGRDQLARRGFYVEPTSAVVWPAMMQLAGTVPEPVVLILTGTGLKTG